MLTVKFSLCNFDHQVSKSHIVAHSGYTDVATTYSMYRTHNLCLDRLGIRDMSSDSYTIECIV
jgi:hypothetical protein